MRSPSPARSEAALGVEVPPRAHWLRALMAELERLANHLGDIGAICNDAAFALMHAHCAVLRERVLRAAAACFGHRLMMDCIVPGGVAVDLAPEGEGQIRALLDTVAKAFPPLVELYDNTTSLQDRTVGTGLARQALVAQYACGGYVGRASGRAFDARRDLPYPPYDRLRFEVPVLDAGDVNARVWIRIREVEQSLALIGQILDGLPAGGALRVPVAGLRTSGRRHGAGRRLSAATSSPGCASTATDASSAAISAIRPGSNGRCWRRRSRATSSPTSPSATNPSTAPIRGTISGACARSCSKAS